LLFVLASFIAYRCIDELWQWEVSSLSGDAVNCWRLALSEADDLAVGRGDDDLALGCSRWVLENRCTKLQGVKFFSGLGTVALACSQAFHLRPAAGGLQIPVNFQE